MTKSSDSFYKASGSSPPAQPMADGLVTQGYGPKWKRTTFYIDGKIYFPVHVLGGVAELCAAMDEADSITSRGHTYVDLDWVEDYTRREWKDAAERDTVQQVVDHLRKVWADHNNKDEV